MTDIPPQEPQPESETTQTATSEPVAPAKASTRPPWYSLNPKHLKFGKITRWLLIIAIPVILLYCFSVKPLWCWGWRIGLYSFADFLSVRDSNGHAYDGGEWARSKEIVVYGLPAVDPDKKVPTPSAHPRQPDPNLRATLANTDPHYVDPRDVHVTADGLKDLVDELGLDFKITYLDKPPSGAMDAWKTCLVKGANDAGDHFDMDKFEAMRLAQRGTKFGEMVLIDATFKKPDWAWGLTSFPSGVSVLQASHCGFPLSRHEGAHLLGYDRHDDMPLYIFGYQETFLPASRDTLMMLNPTDSDELSDRARDALVNFWQGMEDRHHTRYFREE